MVEENKEIREEIENKAWNEIDAIKEKNKEELLKITQIGMNSKADLQLINSKYQDSKKKKDEKSRDIQEKDALLTQQLQTTASMKQEIDGQKNEISEREKTIRDKDNRILSLKKKTQELEKFKFVLKRDIGPREIEIQKLKEQTSKMEQELKHFNRVNQNLGLIVDDLRMRQEGL